MVDASRATHSDDGLCARIDELLLMEHALVESYRAAADRIEDYGLGGTVGDFMRAHQAYIDALEDQVFAHGGRPADAARVRELVRRNGLVVTAVSDDRAMVGVLSDLERRACRIAEKALTDPRISGDPELARLLRNAAIDYEHHADWLGLAEDRM